MIDIYNEEYCPKVEMIFEFVQK